MVCNMTLRLEIQPEVPGALREPWGTAWFSRLAAEAAKMTMASPPEHGNARKIQVGDSMLCLGCTEFGQRPNGFSAFSDMPLTGNITVTVRVEPLVQ